MATGQSKFHKNCRVIDHPVIRHKLTVLRNKKTSSLSFRLIMEELSQFLAYEITSDLKTTSIQVETPFEKVKGDQISEDFVVVSIMRAGNGMLNGVMRILPFARIGHIGIYRDKFVNTTVEYYFRMPKEVKGKKILLLDPLLASGDTACAAIERLKEYEVGPIRFVCALASPEGLKRLQKDHPDVEVVTLSVERELNSNGYIMPGVGDAGDRLYNTYPPIDHPTSL